MAEIRDSKNPNTVSSATVVWTKESKAVFVNGISGYETKCEKHAKLISHHIFSMSIENDEDSKVKSVLNDVVLPTEVDENAEEEILNLLTEDRMTNSNEEDLQLVIFCHSNGVEVVKHALKDAKIERKLRELQKQHNIEDTCRKIKRRVAVVAFGGITIIPPTAAKWVLNYVAVDDLMSRFCLKRKKTHDHVRYVTDDKIIGERDLTKTDNFILKDVRWSPLSANSTASKINYHSLKDYIKREVIITDIKRMLSVSEEPTGSALAADERYCSENSSEDDGNGR